MALFNLIKIHIGKYYHYPLKILKKLQDKYWTLFLFWY